MARGPACTAGVLACEFGRRLAASSNSGQGEPHDATSGRVLLNRSAELGSAYLFSAKGVDLSQPGATPQETSHLPFER